MKNRKTLDKWYAYISVVFAVSLYVFLRETGGFDGEFFGLLLGSYLGISLSIYLYVARKVDEATPKPMRITGFEIFSKELKVTFANNRKMEVPISEFPRLEKASEVERRVFQILVDGSAVVWDELGFGFKITGEEILGYGT